MTREEAINELKNMAKFNYTLAPKEVFEMAIKALEQEPCEDAISRQAVNDAINDVIVKYIPMLYGGCEKIPLELITAIIQLPPVNPQPKTGHWIDHQEDRWIYAKCSECGSVRNTQTNYCPNCGCRMVEPKGSEE